MNHMVRGVLLPMIKRHEGCRLEAYYDTAEPPVITIGYGHTGPDVHDGLKITEAQAEAFLLLDLHEAENDAQSYPWFKRLDFVRQAAIINMLFNLGRTRFSGFKKFIHLMAMNKFEEASVEMLDSKWAGQVGSRAKELSQMIKTGTF
jgi:lysozyme